MRTSGPPPQEFNEHSISRNSNYIASLNVGAPSVHDIQFGSLEMSLSRTLGSRDTLSDDGVNEGDEEQAKEGQASAEGGLEEDEPSSDSQDNLNILVEECGPEVSSGNNVIESHASEKGGSNNIIRSSEAGEKKGLSLEGEQMLVEVFGEDHMDNPVLSGMESNVEKSKHVFDLNEVQNDVAQDEPVATSIQQNNEKGMATGGISKHRRKKKVWHKELLLQVEVSQTILCLHRKLFEDMLGNVALCDGLVWNSVFHGFVMFMFCELELRLSFLAYARPY
nr:hypothetical protein Iba_chr09bCG13750 [Ipomoea batatas]